MLKRFALGVSLLVITLLFAGGSIAQVKRAAVAAPTVTTANTNLHSVSLSCTASVSVVTGYNFYRGTVTGGPYAKINTTLVSTCAFTDTNGVGGTTYFYVATAVDSSGSESVFSNESSALFLGAPAAPTNFKAMSN